MATFPLQTACGVRPVQAQQPLRAVQEIRRTRGACQSHVMRCSDGYYYVVKFPNNRQGRRVLANELMGASLAERLSLPVAHGEVILVEESLVRCSDEMYQETELGRERCQHGLCFGSRFPCDPHETIIYDLIPRTRLKYVSNLRDFWGMLVFDAWTSNSDDRQVIFVNEKPCSYRAVMIDQGLCFGGAAWQLSDNLWKGTYLYTQAYQEVRGVDDFEPWLTALEETIDEDVLSDTASAIPPDWYSSNFVALTCLLQVLLRRKDELRNRIEVFCSGHGTLFPNWKSRAFGARHADADKGLDQLDAELTPTRRVEPDGR